MGLDNRDYIRQTPAFGFSGGLSSWPPVCKALIAINVAVFLLLILTMPPQSQATPVVGWLQLDGRVYSGQVWRLLTCAFCHLDLFHLLMNMLLVFFFGSGLERRLGSGEFLAFYLVAAVLASVAHLGLDLVTGGISAAIGASGAALGTMILYALYYPRQEIYVMFVLPVQIRWVALVIVIGDLFPVLGELGNRSNGDGIAHAAHLGGIAFAFLYWKMGVKIAPFFAKVSPVRPRAGGGQKKKSSGSVDLTVTGRSKAEIDAEVDRLLAKISDQGFQSLSDQEKKFLAKASSKFGK